MNILDELLCDPNIDSAFKMALRKPVTLPIYTAGSDRCREVREDEHAQDLRDRDDESRDRLEGEA